MSRVSVIVPCYNLGEFLDEAVASVHAQTFRDVELVVVDDGSNEPRTQAVLERIAAAGTTVIRSANRGLPAARNLGIERTTGEYICCLDADDALAPTCLAESIQVFDTDPDIAFVSHWFDTFGDESWSWRPTRCDLAMLLDINTVNGAALVRRSIVTQVGGFDESMRDGCEDWEFWIRVTSAGHRGAIVPRVLYHYRRRKESMSRGMEESGRRIDLYEGIVAKHEERYREHLLDLILARERVTSYLHAGVDGTTRQIHDDIEPMLSMRKVELEIATGRLSEPGDPQRLSAALAEARSALAAAVDRVSGLEQSWSWKVTSPLRRAYRLLGLERRNTPPVRHD